MTNKNKIPLRRNARRLAMQALFQQQFVEDGDKAYIDDFLNEHAKDKFDKKYFSKVLDGVLENMPAIDELLGPHCDRALKELNPVELAVLRLATYELKCLLEVPYRVVINEALDITKEFGAVEGYKYVNGVLDALVPTLRKLEWQANQS